MFVGAKSKKLILKSERDGDNVDIWLNVLKEMKELLVLDLIDMKSEKFGAASLEEALKELFPRLTVNIYSTASWLTGFKLWIKHSCGAH